MNTKQSDLRCTCDAERKGEEGPDAYAELGGKRKKYAYAMRLGDAESSRGAGHGGKEHVVARIAASSQPRSRDFAKGRRPPRSRDLLKGRTAADVIAPTVSQKCLGCRTRSPGRRSLSLSIAASLQLLLARSLQLLLSLQLARCSGSPTTLARLRLGLVRSPRSARCSRLCSRGSLKLARPIPAP